MTSAEFTNSIIPARNRRQALDWGLVLASQGIEPVIERSEHGWLLLVAPQDYARAQAALRQYQHENRGWGWRQELPWPEITFHRGAFVWCLLLASFYWLNSVSGSRLESLGVMDRTAVADGSWWRLFTATMLHFDLAHLMANLAIGLPVFGLAMGRYGPACALLAAYLAGAAGNVAGLLLRTQSYYGLGASGTVMGALGLLTVQSLSLERNKDARSWKYVVAGILGGLMLFTLLGLSPAGDVLAHLGGFVCGLVFGVLLSFIPQKKLLATPVNAVSAAVLIGLIAMTWTLALRRGASPP